MADNFEIKFKLDDGGLERTTRVLIQAIKSLEKNINTTTKGTKKLSDAQKHLVKSFFFLVLFQLLLFYSSFTILILPIENITPKVMIAMGISVVVKIAAEFMLSSWAISLIKLSLKSLVIVKNT